MVRRFHVAVAETAAVSGGFAVVRLSLPQPSLDQRAITESSCRLAAPHRRCSLEFYAFDSAYLGRLRQGDAATEQHFVRYFSELIALKLRSRLQSPQATEDVRQETFARVFKLLRKEGAVQQGESLGALVNAICNNVLFEWYRQQGHKEPLDEATAGSLLDSGPSALETVLASETRKAVHKTLDSLQARDRSILRAVFVEERDKDAVCAEMGVDRGYLRVLLHRAKRSFEKSYRADKTAPRAP